MKYVYILESLLDYHHYYIGITDNIDLRLDKDNAGEGSHTKNIGHGK